MTRGRQGAATPRLTQSVPGGPKGQCGAVAILAEVKKHDSSDARAAGTAEDRGDKAGRLVVGEVAPRAKVAGDQPRMPPRPTGQLDVVIRLDRQKVDVAEGIGRRVVPAAGVGEVADRVRTTRATRSPLKSEAECRPGMAQLDRLDPQARRTEEGAIVIVAHKAAFRECIEAAAAGKLLGVRRVAMKADAARREKAERIIVCVVAVRMREHDGGQPVGRQIDVSEPLDQTPRPKSRVDEDRSVIELHDRRVAPRAARQDRESQPRYSVPTLLPASPRGETHLSRSRSGVESRSVTDRETANPCWRIRPDRILARLTTRKSCLRVVDFDRIFRSYSSVHPFAPDDR